MVDHLRLLGHALGEQGRFAEAEQIVRQAISLQPDFPHLHEDLGSVLALQRRFEEAVPCFEQAIRLEPQLPLAHKKLGEALAALGRGREADAAFEEFFERDAERGKVALALDHLRAGRKAEGTETLRTALREDPATSTPCACWPRCTGGRQAALRCRGATASRDHAGARLRRCPAHARCRAAPVGSYPESIEAYREATRLEPGNPVAWAGVGNGLRIPATSARHRGLRAFTRTAATCSERPDELWPRAQDRRRPGGPLRAYRAAIAGKPDFGEVYWSMANLKVFRFEDADLAAMEEQVKRADLGESADIHFRFALGKAYEDRADYDRAWHYYHTGNQRQRKTVFHDPVAMELRHEQINPGFHASFSTQHVGKGHDSAAPIFIVGLPRSGSTLMEQILASHSQVEGTAELPTLMRLAYSIGRFRRPEAVSGGRARPARQRSGPTAGSISRRQRLSAPPTSPSSPTSCRTTSRMSA